MKHIFLLLLLVSITILSCDWAKDKAKKTIHKAGEVAGKTGSELADGISSGVEKSFSVNVKLSDRLKSSGVGVGRIILSGSDSTTDNQVSVYLIFNQDINMKFTAKAVGPSGDEFGRSSVEISAKAGDAKFIDFIFDKRTNVDREDSILIE